MTMNSAAGMAREYIRSRQLRQMNRPATQTRLCCTLNPGWIDDAACHVKMPDLLAIEASQPAGLPIPVKGTIPVAVQKSVIDNCDRAQGTATQWAVAGPDHRSPRQNGIALRITNLPLETKSRGLSSVCRLQVMTIETDQQGAWFLSLSPDNPRVISSLENLKSISVAALSSRLAFPGILK